MNRRLVGRQVVLEQRAFWRNPEAAFFTFAIPVVLLLIFGATTGDDRIPGRTDIDALTLFVPGILAFAIIVAAYGNLAATIAVLRADGVLKRIRATPLQPSTYLTGQLLSALATSVHIACTTVVLGAITFDVAPRDEGFLPIIAVLTVGVICFASLGLAISAFIPSADAAGPITNGTYLPLALVSGTFNTGMVLPEWLDHVVSAFPVKALTVGLRTGYDPAAGRWPLRELAVLGVWAAVGIVLSRRYFRWQPS